MPWLSWVPNLSGKQDISTVNVRTTIFWGMQFWPLGMQEQNSSYLFLLVRISETWGFISVNIYICNLNENTVTDWFWPCAILPAFLHCPCLPYLCLRKTRLSKSVYPTSGRYLHSLEILFFLSDQWNWTDHSFCIFATGRIIAAGGGSLAPMNEF